MKLSISLLAAGASSILLAALPIHAYPFLLDATSIANWFNARRFSCIFDCSDRSSKARIYNLQSCRFGDHFPGTTEKSVHCEGYADFINKRNPNGKICAVEIVYVPAHTSIGGGGAYTTNPLARIVPQQNDCYQRLDMVIE